MAPNLDPAVDHVEYCLAIAYQADLDHQHAREAGDPDLFQETQSRAVLADLAVRRAYEQLGRDFHATTPGGGYAGRAVRFAAGISAEQAARHGEDFLVAAGALMDREAEASVRLDGETQTWDAAAQLAAANEAREAEGKSNLPPWVNEEERAEYEAVQARYAAAAESVRAGNGIPEMSEDERTEYEMQRAEDERQAAIAATSPMGPEDVAAAPPEEAE